jgi:hypothetical protein
VKLGFRLYKAVSDRPPSSAAKYPRGWKCAEFVPWRLIGPRFLSVNHTRQFTPIFTKFRVEGNLSAR